MTNLLIDLDNIVKIYITNKRKKNNKELLDRMGRPYCNCCPGILVGHPYFCFHEEQRIRDQACLLLSRLKPAALGDDAKLRRPGTRQTTSA